MISLKSAREIERMRESAHLVGRTIAEVAKHVRPGVSTAELDRVAEEFILRHNAKPAFKNYKVGRLVYPKTLCLSVNEEVVHGIPGKHVLKEGDLLSIDCGVVLDGYYGDSAYTVAVGKISPENAKLCQVTYEALYRGVDKAITGNRIGDIGYAVQSHCEAHGYGVVRELVGHGIGRKMHEEPQVPNYGHQGSGRKLKDGLVICIEPMINRGTHEVVTDPDGWTIRTADGLPSAHYEHMVAVHGGKPEILSTFEYIEEVVEAPYQEKVTYVETVGH